MDNTNENETPLFGKKAKAEPVATPVVATPSATPVASTEKKTSIGLIIGAIITGLALIAAVVILIIVIINRQPSTSSDKKSDDSSKGAEDKPLKLLDDEPKSDTDEDEDKDEDDEDEDEDEDEEEEDEDTTTSDYSLSFQGKTLIFSNDYVANIKNALKAGFDMTYEDTSYKSHPLTTSNLSDYLSMKTKYGSTEVSIVDGNGDDVITIRGTRDYSVKESESSYLTPATAKFYNIRFSSTTSITLPNSVSISCYNTTLKDVTKAFGAAEKSSLDIIHYHIDGLNYAFHFDSHDTVQYLYISID